MVRGASGLRSNRQAGSGHAEYEPALPRVRGAKSSTSGQPRGRFRGGQRTRVPAQQQQPRAQRVRGMRGQDRREVPLTRARQILAPRMSEVRVLRTSSGRHGKIVLLQRRNDSLQKRLHEVSAPIII